MLTPPSQLLPLLRSFGAALVSSDLGCGEVIYTIRRRSIASCSSRQRDYTKQIYKRIVQNISVVIISRSKKKNKGLFTNYVTQKWGNPDPPFPLRQPMSAFPQPPSPLRQPCQNFTNPPSLCRVSFVNMFNATLFLNQIFFLIVYTRTLCS